MNSLFGRFRFVAAAVCGLALTLAGCNAIEDVRESASTPLPVQLEVVGGTIDGLGYRRPVVLEDQGKKRCPDTANVPNNAYCSVSAFGNFDERYSKFTFGSVPVGTPYNIKVKTQPFGKICTVDPTLGQGVVAADSQVINVPVTCTNVSTSVLPQYCVGGILTQASHDVPGLRITLSSEEGLTTLSDDPAANADGPLPAVTTAGTCWFDPTRYPKAGIFNNGTSVPVFKWYVTATFPTLDTDGVTKLTNNCRVTGGASGFGSNDSGADTTLPPSADVLNVSIAACDFQISGTLGYSQPAGVAFTGRTISGLQLQLQDTAGNVVKDKAGNAVTYDVPAYPVTVATTTQTFTFGGTTPNRLLSNSKALYDVVVTAQPAGMFCVVSDSYVVRPSATNFTPYTIAGGAGARLAAPIYAASFVTAAPASLPWATYGDVPAGSLSVRCRATPGTTGNASTVLTGTYQRTNLASSTATTPAVTRTLSRDFLTFFDDGSFLYGARNAGTLTTAAQGVERGFYYYDATAKTISFTVLTDTNNNVTFNPGGAASGNVTTAGGISAVPTPTGLISAPTLTNVTKSSTSPNRITAHISGPTSTTTAGVTTTVQTDWELNEPTQTAGKMRGTWVTDDHRRVWVYDENTIFGFHVGVNGGAANLQDACFILYDEANNQDADAVKGFYSRRGTSTIGGGDLSGGSTSQNSTGCPISPTTAVDTSGVPTGGAFTSSTADLVDAVSNNSTSQEAFLVLQYPNFVGRLPGAQSAFSGRSPSPSPFTITPGTPDSVTISATNYGTPVPGSSVTFKKNRAVPAP